MRSCLERIQERDGTVNREGAKFYSVTLDTIGWFGKSVADLGLLADLYARGQAIFLPAMASGPTWPFLLHRRRAAGTLGG